jgi:hypothetical protein
MAPAETPAKIEKGESPGLISAIARSAPTW